MMFEELKLDMWLKTATGRYARVIAIDKLTKRVEVSIHDSIVSAQVLKDGSNTIDVPFKAAQVWTLVNPKIGV